MKPCPQSVRARGEVLAARILVGVVVGALGLSINVSCTILVILLVREPVARIVNALEDSLGDRALTIIGLGCVATILSILSLAFLGFLRERARRDLL